MDKITFYAYRYAPESARATFNGQPVNIQGTAIPLQICSGQHAEAVNEIKRIARKRRAEKSKFTYAFLDKKSNKFYYIPELYFRESDDIYDRLRCFKCLKETLQKNPPQIIIEYGNITPKGSKKSKTVTETVQIDFARLIKVKIKEAAL